MNKTQSPHKLNIFSVLGNINKKNTSFYSKLSDEEQKSLQPLVLMRWLTGTSDLRQIYFINELVNPFVFPLNKHKKLLVNLLSVCTSGKFQKYKWIKKHSKKQSNYPVSVSVIKEYFNYSTKDAIECLPLLSKDAILSYAIELGKQKEDIKSIEKELK